MEGPTDATCLDLSVRARFLVSAWLARPDLSAVELAGPAALHSEAVAGPAHQTCADADVLPCFLGYIRLGPSDTPADLARMHMESKRFAKREGIALGHTYVEKVDAAGSYGWRSSAFCALIDALGYPEVDGIVVPSLQHLAESPGLAEDLRSLIESEIGVRILVLRSDPAGTR